VTRPHLATAVALGAFTLLTYFQFPGHTWLQQDSQIYVAMLEHLDNPATLSRDLLCVHPHVKWTAFDEIARALHAVTGLGYHTILDIQMLIFRFLGLVGIFLLAGSAGLNRIGAIFVSFLFGLGMFVGGAEILTLEYEAVPRGFALMLILAALGYGAYRRWKVSVAFAALALLYHPPTSFPYWLAVVVYALALQRPKALRTALIGFSSACFVLLTLAAFQAGEHESQPLFSVIPYDLISLLRLRGWYNWVDLWKPDWLWEYVLLGVFAAGAWLRLRREITPELAALSATLLLYGMLSIPLSWLFLNKMRWSMMPQFQPARAVIFVCVFAIILGGAAAWSAARRGRWLESAAWLLPLFALPANRLALDLFTQPFADPLVQRRLPLVIGLALTAALAARWQKAAATALLVPVAAAFLIPGVGQLRNYSHAHSPELTALSEWAAARTQPDAMFHFRRCGAGLDAGHLPGRGRARPVRRLEGRRAGESELDFRPGVAEPLELGPGSPAALASGRGIRLSRHRLCRGRAAERLARTATGLFQRLLAGVRRQAGQPLTDAVH
jgi:hypothetical protein